MVWTTLLINIIDTSKKIIKLQLIKNILKIEVLFQNYQKTCKFVSDSLSVVCGVCDNSLPASPRYDFSVTEMFGGQPVPRDFRRKGYTSQHMLSPRQPVRHTAVDERKMNEEKLVRCFGDRSLYQPGKWTGHVV